MLGMSRPPKLMVLCPHPQDQGAFLCVVDDSNEHMLSVWDCSRGVKLAEIKVRSLGGFQIWGRVGTVEYRQFQACLHIHFLSD